MESTQKYIYVDPRKEQAKEAYSLVGLVETMQKLSCLRYSDTHHVIEWWYLEQVNFLTMAKKRIMQKKLKIFTQMNIIYTPVCD